MFVAKMTTWEEMLLLCWILSSLLNIFVLHHAKALTGLLQHRWSVLYFTH
jgi:hypothetical protein